MPQTNTLHRNILHPPKFKNKLHTVPVFQPMHWSEFDGLSLFTPRWKKIIMHRSSSDNNTIKKEQHKSEHAGMESGKFRKIWTVYRVLKTNSYKRNSDNRVRIGKITLPIHACGPSLRPVPT